MTEPADLSEQDHAYFRAVEETFIRLRGAPLLLSPADWQIARRWRREGVPLDLVCRVLEQFFARRKERGRSGAVQSLKYCAPAVDEAWEEVRALGAGGRREPPEPIDPGPRLRALAASLPAALPAAAAVGARLAGLEGDAERVESALRELDDELVAAAAAALTETDRQRLSERVDASFAALGDRLPEAERRAARERLFRQALRRELGLPVLSLFSPEAQPD